MQVGIPGTVRRRTSIAGVNPVGAAATTRSGRKKRGGKKVAAGGAAGGGHALGLGGGAHLGGSAGRYCRLVDR